MLLTDHLVPLRLWSASALTSTGTLTTDAIDVSRFSRLESFTFILAVGSGNPDIKVEMAVGDDQGNYGAFADNVLCASTVASFALTPSGLNVIAMPAPLGLRIKFQLTELASKATTVTAILIGRE